MLSTVLPLTVLTKRAEPAGSVDGSHSRRIGPREVLLAGAVALAIFTIPVMWLLMTFIRRYAYRLPLGFIAFFSVTTAFSLAAYYEITELIDERLLGGQRLWTPRDTVQDLAADLGGIVIKKLRSDRCDSAHIQTPSNLI